MKAKYLITGIALLCCLLTPVLAVFGQCPGGYCPNGQCGTQPKRQPHQVVAQTPQFPPRCDYPALVTTYFRVPGDNHAMAGTGFVVDRMGNSDIVLTCAHGYNAMTEAEVRTQAGGRYAAAILGVDAVEDICVLRIANTGLKPMRIADLPPNVGDRVYMAGYAHVSQFNGNWGVIQGWYSPRKMGEQTFLKATCRVVEGDSGSPILGADGAAVGLVTAMDGDRGSVGCTGPCLAKTLPKMRLSATESESLQLCQSRMPWRQGMLNQEKQTNQALGQIGADLKGIASRPESAPPPQIAALPSAPAIDLSPVYQQLQAHGQAIDQLRTDLPKMVDERIKPLVDQTEALNKNIKENGTMREQFTAAKVDAAAKNPDESKVKQDLDAAKEMLATHKQVWIVLAVVGFVGGLVLVVWNIMHGKGLVRKIADNIAAHHPDNLAARKAAAFLDQHEDALRDQLTKIPALAALTAANPAAGVAAATLSPLLQQVGALQSQQAAQAQTLAQVALNTPSPTQTTAASAVPSAPAIVNITAPAGSTTSPAAASH